jgi:hypothetical protein
MTQKHFESREAQEAGAESLRRLQGYVHNCVGIGDFLVFKGRSAQRYTRALKRTKVEIVREVVKILELPGLDISASTWNEEKQEHDYWPAIGVSPYYAFVTREVLIKDNQAAETGNDVMYTTNESGQLLRHRKVGTSEWIQIAKVIA